MIIRKKMLSLVSVFTFAVTIFTITSTFEVNANASSHHGTKKVLSSKYKSEIKNVSYKYDITKKEILIYGKATKSNKIAVKYGSNKSKTFKVNKNSNFKAYYRFRGYKTFTIYGVNKNGRIVSKLYKLSSQKYASENPVVYKVTRNSKGEIIHVNNDVPSVIKVYNNGKLLKKIVADSVDNTIFLSKKNLQKKNKITIDQQVFNKKTSRIVKVPSLSVGEVSVINY